MARLKVLGLERPHDAPPQIATSQAPRNDGGRRGERWGHHVRGESRGAQPLWQGSGGVPQRALCSSPFLPGRGLGGWSEPPLRPHSPKPKYRPPPLPRLPRRRLLAMTAGGGDRGSPEGHSLFGRGLGVSLRTSFYFPLPSGRGPGGWSEPPLRPHSRSRSTARHPTPDCHVAGSSQ